MIILEAYVRNFGKLSEVKIDFEKDIHIFYGENESGKSTLFSFLIAMLFGMEPQRGPFTVKDLYRFYEPWQNPQIYGGYIRFTCGNKDFFLERNFARGKRQSYLKCETDGEELSVEAGDLEVILGGITEKSFCNTLAVSQLGARTDESFSAELANLVTNYEKAGDSSVDVSGAVKKLMEKKKDFERENRQLILEKDAEMQALRMKAEYIENEIINLKEQHSQQKQQSEELAADIDKLEKHITRNEKRMHEKKKIWEEEQQAKNKQNQNNAKDNTIIIKVGALIVFTILFMAGMFSRNVILFLAGMVGTVISGLIFYRSFGNRNNDIEEESEEFIHPEAEAIIQENKKIQKDLKESTKHYNSSKAKAEQAAFLMKDKMVEYENLQNLLKENLHASAEQRILQTEIHAVDKAIETIHNLTDEMRNEIGSRLNKEASSILNEITSAKYTRLEVEKDLSIYIYTGDQQKRLEQMSRGTMEQVYFAVRMAVTRLFYDEEIMPILLDEPFAMYDDERLTGVLAWLKKAENQIILFTCQKREMDILNEI